MSVYNHPNINAAGFTSDVMAAFMKHLRGKAGRLSNKSKALDLLDKRLIPFVVCLSNELDDTFGTDIPPFPKGK